MVVEFAIFLIKVPSYYKNITKFSQLKDC